MTPEHEFLLKEILDSQKKLRAEMVRLELQIDALKTRAVSESIDAITSNTEEPKKEQPLRTKGTPPPVPSHVFAAQSPVMPPVFETRESQVADSVELRIGTYWFVRLGIIIVLTGIVFLGNYAYKNYFGQLPSLARLAFFFMIGTGITVCGLFLERKERLQNYGRVLAGGGIAALYYTLYAAHYVEKLRVIESPFLAGILLLIFTGGMMAFAEWKCSQTLATFSIALSLYTCGINTTESFTLIAMLFLICAAMRLVMRYGWYILGFATMLGTWITFGVWSSLFFSTANGHVNWQLHTGFLVLYWSIFTGIGLYLKQDYFVQKYRPVFLILNNGFAFAWLLFITHSHVQASTVSFLVALTLGGITSGLARYRERYRELIPAYFAQALFLLVCATILYFEGIDRAFVLIAESVFLSIAWMKKDSVVLRVGALILGYGGMTSLLFEEPVHSVYWIIAAGLFLVLSVANERIGVKRQSRFPYLEGYGFAYIGGVIMAFFLAKKVDNEMLSVSFTLLALLLLIFYQMFKTRGILIAGQCLLLVAWLIFFGRLIMSDDISWMQLPVLVAMGGIGMGERYFQNTPGAKGWTFIWNLGAMLGFWIYLQMWGADKGYPITVLWSLLGSIYLGLGFFFEKRLYRFFGFLLLALSLGRVVFHDLWSLGALARIVSLISLGLVLLLLGFVYTKFQDRIKKWL